MLTLVIGSKNLSSWSLRPWIAMRQAGLEFEEIVIPLDTPTTHQEILKYSPTGKVPLLLHEQLSVWESLAICEYVAEQLAPQLWPTDVKARAMARSISSEMHAGFAALRQHMPMDCRSRYPGQGLTPQVQADIDRIVQIWQDCRRQFGQGGEFLFGQFSIADAMYAPVVSRFVTYGVALEGAAQAYMNSIWGLPSMQSWVHAASQEAA